AGRFRYSPYPRRVRPLRAIEHIERFFLRLIGLLAALSGAVLVLVALLIPVNLLLRACCSTSIFGLLDAVEYGLMAATFLAAPWVLVQGAHVAVDIVTLNLPGRLRRPLAHLVNLLGMILSSALAWYAFSAALVSYQRGSMIRTAFAVPEWLTLLAPGICGVLLAVEFLRRITRHPPASRSAPGL
ncbi:MAG: TRAP transporter small permease, partial [Proteobacteria bacterium]